VGMKMNKVMGCFAESAKLESEIKKDLVGLRYGF